MDLLLAAVDTTSHTAAWALHCLSSDRDIQAAIREEIKLKTEGVVTSDSVKRLPYLGGFIKEVMRLYPVAPFLTRLATQSFRLGENHLADFTSEEIVSMMNGLSLDFDPSNDRTEVSKDEVSGLPDSVDWRTKVRSRLTTEI